MDHNEKCKFTSTVAKLCITSLNSHYPLRELRPKYGSLVSRGKVWVKVYNTHSEPDWSIKKAEPVTPQSLKNSMVKQFYQPTAKKW